MYITETEIDGNKFYRVRVGKFVIVHHHPNHPPSRGRELIRFADKYSPSTGGRGLGGGGAELLRKFYIKDEVSCLAKTLADEGYDVFITGYEGKI